MNQLSKLVLDEGFDAPEKLDVSDFEQRKAKYEQLHEDVDVETDNMMAVNSIISSLIQSKWQAIDALNGNIIALQQYNRPDVVEVLSAMISDNYVHIGQLEKVLEMNGEAEEIETGKEAVENVVDEVNDLGDVEVETEPVEEESLDESQVKLANVKFSVGPDHPLHDKVVPAIITKDAGYNHKQVYGKALDPVDWPEDPEGINVFDKQGNLKRVEPSRAHKAEHAGYVDEIVDEFPADDVDESLAESIDFKKAEAAK